MPVPPTIPEDSEASTPSEWSPVNRSPIHNTKYKQDTLHGFNAGDRVCIGEILHYVVATIASKLPRIPANAAGSEPSHSQQSKSYQWKEFASPNLHLTDEVLDTEVKIQDLLHAYLRILLDTCARSYEENDISQHVVKPMVKILLAIFQELAAGTPGKWQSRALAPYRHSPSANAPGDGFSLELDVVIDCEGIPLPDDLPDVLGPLVSAIEMKTPRACSNTPIRTLGISPVQVAINVRNQIGKQGALIKRVHPYMPFVIHGLSLAPSILRPLASDGSDTFALGSDLLNITDAFPLVVENRPNWLEYIDKLGALVLIIMCRHDDGVAAVVARYEKQWQQKEAFDSAVGKALERTLIEVLLTALWAGIFWLQRALSVPLILMLVQLQSLQAIRTLKQRRHDQILLDTKFSPALPFSLALPWPSAVHETVENIIYIYSDWCTRLVIKVFTNEKTYANELVCYRTLASLQGAGIPRLLGTATSAGLPCLVLSYEGNQLRDDLSVEERAALEPVVKAIHENGLHHHDLHPRNVVRDARGKLSIIDFGFAGLCDNPDCQDEWKSIWDN